MKGNELLLLGLGAVALYLFSKRSASNLTPAQSYQLQQQALANQNQALTTNQDIALANTGINALNTLHLFDPNPTAAGGTTAGTTGAFA